ncbi:MAG: ABC transporter substrate-binding protein [Nocardioidaceae bacterium]|nr:ABC transporter substrate-binding protein [Nocardioidaceae bacterium]
MNTLRLGRHVAAVVALVAMAATSACGSSADGSSSGKDSSLTVGLSYIGTVEHYGPYYAEEEGLYRKAGLSVKVEPGSDTHPATLLEAGRIDIGVMDAPDLLQFVEKGADLVAIATEFQSAPLAMICRQDSGVTSMSELQGHRLGLKTYSRPYLSLVAHAAHAKPSDLDIVPVGNADVSTIIAGKVDCIFATYAFNEPRAIEAQGVKVNVITLADMGLPAQGNVYVVTRKTLEKRRADLVAWVKATADAWSTFLDDPDAAATYMVDKQFTTGLEIGQQKYQATAQVPYLNTTWTAEHGLLALNPEAWKQTSEVAAAEGLTTKAVDPAPLLDDLTAAAGTPKR